MKIRKSFILLTIIFVFSFFSFSQQTVYAMENNQAEDKETHKENLEENEETKEVEDAVGNEEKEKSSTYTGDKELLEEDSSEEPQDASNEEKESDEGNAENESTSIETSDESKEEESSLLNSNSNETTLYETGDSGEHVVELKEKLIKLGFANWGSLDNIYDSNTEEAVKEFQNYYNLEVTGKADEITRTKMDEVLSPPYQDGDRGLPIVELKEKLVQLGFASWSNPSQFYGSYTMVAVNDFQSHYGFNEPGVVTQEMLEKMDEVLSGQYQNGDRGEHIVDLKEKLVQLGFASWNPPTEHYGPITAGIVEDFQDYYGLPVTGIADAATRDKIDKVFSPPYQDGDRGEPIVELKEKLVQLGFATWSNPSQYYGSYTIEAVNAFQSHYGFEQPGIVTQEMLDKMDEILSGEYRDGDRGKHVIALKEDLVRLGFASWDPPTASYGPITAGVVEGFQEYYGLPVTGIANTATRDKIEEVLNPPYQDGDRGEPIVELKEKLVELGFATWSNPSQFYGSYTIEAVNAFQSHYDFEQPGIVTQEMLDKMDEVLSGEYRDGDRGEHVVALKEDLVKLGFANWDPPTNNYGPITAGVVSEFQEYYGLPISGIADKATRNKIAGLLESSYLIGDSGPHIVELKEDLVQLGFANWNPPSNSYGPITAGVVEDFQAYFNLKVTGVVDKITREKITEVLTPPFQDGDRGEPVIDLKEKLVALGFATWSNPSQFYGFNTKNAVKNFQWYYGLEENGTADESTLEMLDKAIAGEVVRYQDGDRGAHVGEMKENLVQLGFASWNPPTNSYGSITASRVKDFQEYYGLPVTGIADPDTLNKMNDILSGPFVNGDRGSHVVELKEKLVILGFANWSSPSPSYGDITEGVVKDFQEAYGLKVSGIADEVTRTEMENNIVKIFLDPGHGDHDAGGEGYGLKEKNVVLDIALKTADILLANYIGVNVQLSRTNDTFVELEERAEMANDWNADYFVSFHANAFNGSTRGFETYIHNGDVSNETRQRQQDIHNYLSDRINVPDRGMKDANFSVLRNTSMPALLIEYMFIDNFAENALLKDASYRTQLARFTAEALASSFNLNRR